MPVTARHRWIPHATTRGQRGSALLLVPAGIIIVVSLGAMAVNASLSFMAERSAAATASEVANDLATLAFDEEHFRRTGEYRLSPDLSAVAAERVARAETGGGTGLVPGSLNIDVRRLTSDTVEVVVTARVSLLIRPPGGDPSREVVARATATAADVLP